MTPSMGARIIAYGFIGAFAIGSLVLLAVAVGSTVQRAGPGGRSCAGTGESAARDPQQGFLPHLPGTCNSNRLRALQVFAMR